MPDYACWDTIIMRRELAIVGSTLFVLACLSMSSMPVAASDVIIEPGTSFTQLVTISGGSGTIIFSWTASHSVSFSIIDPDGNTVYGCTGASRTAAKDVSQAGTYTLRWSNTMGTAVSLTYSATPASISLGGLGALIAVAIIVVAIIITVIVIVIVFLVRRPRMGFPEYAPYPPPAGVPGYPLTPGQQMASQPMSPQIHGPQYVGPPRDGKCPRCGSDVVLNALFCPKCGARLG